MELSWYGNTGTDAAPVWELFGDDTTIHATGAGSSANNMKPVTKPSAGYVWNEELWLGPPVPVANEQFAGWVKPSAAVQSGKIMKVVFSDAPNAAPYLTAYDDANANSWEKEILTGTELTGWKGLLKAFITGSEASNTPPAQNWAYMETGNVGNSNPNDLTGNESFVTIPFIPAAGGDVTFTIALAVPADIDHGQNEQFNPIIAIAFVHV